MSETLVIGAGPAGLTAAYELAKNSASVEVFEKDSVVGGIARTAKYKGYHFDIGGHRLFTKVRVVQELWEELLGDDLLLRPRLSRIHYNDRFFDYPLKPMNALAGLGPAEATRILLSYIAARVWPSSPESNFEQWVSNRFGHRLFEIFFKTYTEKVWGMPCDQISSDWAAQRIKDLDLLKAVQNAVFGSKSSSEVITTLVDQFHYPRLGPGMLWENCREQLDHLGTPVHLSRKVTRLHHAAGRVRAATVSDAEGQEVEIDADHFISSMPIGELIRALTPRPPADVIEAAKRLRYRDFLSVILIVDREHVFADNWIYVHSADVHVGRVQNYKNWSPEMVPDSAKTSLGLEYFLHKEDDLWHAPDAELLELGEREMLQLGLIAEGEVEDGTVVRMPKAYPVYDSRYQEAVSELQDFLSTFENLQAIGRNGQHRYNNQDHSMLAGVFAARNVNGADYDVWTVNVEREYHEETPAARDSPEGRPPHEQSGRDVPVAATPPALEALISQAFARYDAVALGVAVGLVSGLSLFVFTVSALLRGDSGSGAFSLSLLSNYFIGYEVTWRGAMIGLAESTIGGFAIGYVLAKEINLLVGTIESSLKRKLALARVMDPLETPNLD